MDEIAFGTDGWRATLSTFTDERVRAVAQAVATYLEDGGIDGPIAVGYDARESSPGFADTIAEVLAANGREVVVASRDCPTPALAWTVANGPFAGGVVVTASHNPPSYNGVKFVPADGAPALPAVTDALERALGAPETNGAGEIRRRDLNERYVEATLAVPETVFGLTPALDELELVYDAMHGSGRGVTDRVLERAGATVERRRCEPDPEFGGVSPEPTPANARETVEIVKDGEAALGLVNDGDADRVALVTPERGFLDPNVVLALVYEFLLEHADGDVVRTVPTSSLVDRVAAAHGHAVYETAVGFKWVAEAMGEHDVLVGGEESGGYGVSAHLRNKDGVLLALLAAVAHRDRPLDDRITELFDTYGEVHQGRLSVDCSEDRKRGVLGSLEDDLPATVAGAAVENVNTVDGLKLTLADGTWLLVRPSGTEPTLRVYAEATDDGRLDALLEAGRQLVEPLVR